MEFLFSSRFKKDYKKLSDDIKNIVNSKLELLSENHKHSSSRTKKIKEREYIFESSMNMAIRITWQYTDNKILLRAIGNHDITLKNP